MNFGNEQKKMKSCHSSQKVGWVNMGDLRDILGIQAPKVATGPVVPGTKPKNAPPVEQKTKKPRT